MSLIGAVVLYVFAIGSVRGFAFFLGLSTALDLVLAYCFMHPLVSVLARRPRSCGCRASASAPALDVAGGDGMTDHGAAAPEPSDIPGVTRRHRPSDLYHERTNFQFIKHSAAG